MRSAVTAMTTIALQYAPTAPNSQEQKSCCRNRHKLIGPGPSSAAFCPRRSSSNAFMPRLTIDRPRLRRDVPEGSTRCSNRGARTLDIDVPTSVFRGGCTPSTSCLACVVQIDGGNRLVPSCAALAAEGMRVESETAAVQGAAHRVGIAVKRPLGRLCGPLPIRLPGENGHSHPCSGRSPRASSARHRHGETRHRAAGRAGTDLRGPVRKGLPSRRPRRGRLDLSLEAVGGRRGPRIG